MTNLAVVEYQDRRVLTTGQLAEAYGTTTRRISENFNANKSRYKQGKHFYALEGDNKREFLNHTEIPYGSQNAKVIYLWTQNGTLLHAKSLNTDKAWEVYQNLVDDYFSIRNSKHNTTSGHPLLEQSVYHLQQSQQYTTNALLEHSYEIGELKAKYATAQAEIKTLKSQATRTERKLNNHLKNKPTITYFGDIEALYNNMSDIYQSFTTCYNVNGEKNTNGKSIFRIVQLDGDRLVFRGTKYNNNRMFVDNIVKAERIDNHNGHYSSSKFRLYLGDITSVIELEAVRKSEGSGYKMG